MQTNLNRPENQGNPICVCPRCGKKSIFVERQTISKAGDNGFCSGTGFSCSKCGFAPFILPEIKGYEEETKCQK